MLAFGDDGYLYIGVGDGGGSYDPDANAQNLNSLMGKLLRIDVDRTAGGNQYASPSDNPFVGIDGRDEIYSYGLRNPWRFSFDRQTGEPWVGDVGQGAREEVDTPMVSGGNYGWPILEGTVCTPQHPGCSSAGTQLPRFGPPIQGALLADRRVCLSRLLRHDAVRRICVRRLLHWRDLLVGWQSADASPRHVGIDLIVRRRRTGRAVRRRSQRIGQPDRDEHQRSSHHQLRLRVRR